MLTKEVIELKFKQHPELQKRINTLKVASEINPDFKNPNISGGYLRDIILDVKPCDCDVFFEGYTKEQSCIVECIQAAEKQLGYSHYPDWEFDNTLATGATNDLFENTIGFYSNHTDYLSLMLYDSQGNLRIGLPQTLHDLETRTYDVRYQGVLIWTMFRDRTFDWEMAGVATRGLYLCHKLGLHPSAAAEDLFRRFEFHFRKMNDEDKKGLVGYWMNKTKGLKGIKSILNKYGVESLP